MLFSSTRTASLFISPGKELYKLNENQLAPVKKLSKKLDMAHFSFE